VREEGGGRRRTQTVDGVKNSLVARAGIAMLLRLVMLFWREKVGWPTGIFPRAFSDMPRTCVGTDSSMVDSMDALLEAPEGDCGGSIGCASSTSESSSSPIANALFSSGTLPSVGVRETVGLRRLSIELVLCVSAELSLRS
jgi:hypothetical protein